MRGSVFLAMCRTSTSGMMQAGPLNGGDIAAGGAGTVGYRRQGGTAMDPNVTQATLLATERERDRWTGPHPMHVEREMVAWNPTTARSRHFLLTALRRRLGTALILMGQRLQGAPRLADASEFDAMRRESEMGLSR